MMDYDYRITDLVPVLNDVCTGILF